MTPRILLLVRHGESEANRAGTFDGYADAALTDRGRHQAMLAGARLAARSLQRVRIISSPLQRALHTAQAIASALSSEVQLDRRLLAGEGRPGQSLGEAGAEVAQALQAAWASWDGTLIAVSHRLPIRGYLQLLYGAAPAATLVDALGNGEALELKLGGETAGAPIHHRLTDVR